MVLFGRAVYHPKERKISFQNLSKLTVYSSVTNFRKENFDLFWIEIIPNGSMEGMLKGVHIGTQITGKGFCDEVAFVVQIPNPFMKDAREVKPLISLIILQISSKI